MTVKNKVILVTGGAKRVGAAICCKLHTQGAKLMVHYRSSQNDAQMLRQALEQTRPDSIGLIQADMLEIERLSDLIEETSLLKKPGWI